VRTPEKGRELWKLVSCCAKGDCARNTPAYLFVIGISTTLNLKALSFDESMSLEDLLRMVDTSRRLATPTSGKRRQRRHLVPA